MRALEHAENIDFYWKHIAPNLSVTKNQMIRFISAVFRTNNQKILRHLIRNYSILKTFIDWAIVHIGYFGKISKHFQSFETWLNLIRLVSSRLDFTPLDSALLLLIRLDTKNRFLKTWCQVDLNFCALSGRVSDKKNDSIK